MKRLMSLTALVGMLIAVGSAQAQSVNLDISPSLMGSDMQPVEGASGTYHVTINPLDGNQFEVIVYGNDDGNYQDASLNQPSPPPDPPVAKSGIGRISMNFAAGDTFDAGDPSAGASTAYSGAGPGVGVSNNVGGPRNLEFGAGGGDWFFVDHDLGTIVFTTPYRDRFVAPHGGNEFRGTFSLANANWTRVGVSLQDSGQQWSGEAFRTQQAAVPEASSLALLLPGLLPLALVIRRRRR